MSHCCVGAVQTLQVLLDAKARVQRGESLSATDGSGHGGYADGKYGTNVAVVAEAYAMAYAEPADEPHSKAAASGGAYDSKYDYDYRY